MDGAGIYRRARPRIVALVAERSAGELATPVGACPLWTVQDVVAHLAGAAADIAAGRFEGAGSEPWTAKQVEDRRGRPIGELLAEWDEHAPALEAALPVPQLAFDILTHEWDLRGALHEPGDKADADVLLIAEQMIGFLDRRVREAGGLAPLRVVTGTDEHFAGGEGEPGATLTVDPFELVRLVFGRRSERQLRSYDWDGDPEPYVGRMTVFAPAAEDLTEP